MTDLKVKAEKRVAELEAENASLKEWQALVSEAPAEAHEQILERMNQSGALQPILKSWKAKVEELEGALVEAGKLLEATKTAAHSGGK